MNPLTSVDIAALRKADSILFHHKDDDGKIAAVKEAREASARNPFPTESRHVIPVESSVRRFTRGEGNAYTAFCMISSAQYSPAWTTIAALLRAGDVLSLAWYRGNNSPVITDAGLVRDELRLCVKRGDKQRFVFIVEVSVGQDNTARMTQRAHRN